MTVSKENNRVFYEKFQFNMSMVFLLFLLAGSIACVFFDLDSVLIYYIVVLFYLCSIIFGVVTALHVQMICLPRVGCVRLEENPVFFYLLSFGIFSLIAIPAVIYSI